MDPRPVGIFDSGAGGLSVFRAFRAMAPHERVVYFADTAYFPYGPRPAAEVRKRSFAVTQRLLASDVKLIIVACNTASAAAIDDLRAAFPVPFVGMVPGLKPAASSSPNRHVTILATEGTLDGGLYSRVVDDFGRGTVIDNIPGVGLAELVERGEAGTAAARSAVRRSLAAPIGAGADTIVLGCTHYAFLAGDIAAEFPGAAIVDTSEAVARRAVQVLKENGLEAPEDSAGDLDLIVSGDRERFRETMGRLGFAPAPAEAAP
jgi:glutamate racemase